jgi:WD40 repeat protein
MKDSLAWWKLIRDVEYSALPSGHTGPVFALQVAGLPAPGDNDENDGGYVFSCSLDNTVRVWDPSAGRDGSSKPCVQTLRGHGGTVRHAAGAQSSDDGGRLVLTRTLA